MTSLTTIGPQRAARLSVPPVAVGRVRVDGAAGAPRIIVPPGTVPVPNPFEMNRLATIVIGPVNVRLNVSPGLLSMANPVFIRIALEIARLPPTGRRCWLDPLLTLIWPVPNGPAVNDPGGPFELTAIGMIVPAPVRLVPPE